MSNGFSGFWATAGVGELDQRHVGVGAEQLVGGVAVLAGVEDRLAVDDRQEGLQLAAVPGRPDRRVAQRQEARVDGAADEDHREHRPRQPRERPPADRLRCAIQSASERAGRTRRAAGGRRPASPAGRAIISALACE